jgi:hypothetical protein
LYVTQHRLGELHFPLFKSKMNIMVIQTFVTINSQRAAVVYNDFHYSVMKVKILLEFNCLYSTLTSVYLFYFRVLLAIFACTLDNNEVATAIVSCFYSPAIQLD